MAEDGAEEIPTEDTGEVEILAVSDVEDRRHDRV